MQFSMELWSHDNLSRATSNPISVTLEYAEKQGFGSKCRTPNTQFEETE